MMGKIPGTAIQGTRGKNSLNKYTVHNYYANYYAYKLMLTKIINKNKCTQIYTKM